MELIPHNKASQIVKIDDLHKPIAKGLFTLEGQQQIQADNIIEQIEVLKKQAIKIQENKRISKKIYESEIKFEPIVMGVYYLYTRNGGLQFISMVGPMEWGRSQKSTLDYICKIRLQYDHTWEILDLNAIDFFN